MKQSLSGLPVHRRISALITLSVLVTVVSMAAAPAVQAAFFPGRSGTSLTLRAPATSRAGAGIAVSAVLDVGFGRPVPGQTVWFSVNGTPAASTRTDWNGAAAASIPGSFVPTAGQYSLKAQFAGGRGLWGSSAGATINVTGATATPMSVLAGGSSGTVRNGAVVRTGTRVIVAVPSGSVLGKDVTVTAQLVNARGAALAGEHLSLFLDNVQMKSDRTDAHGRVSFVILGKKLNAAQAYAVQVVYPGSHFFLPSHTIATMTILEGAIQVQTMPPLANIRFTLGSETAVTGPDGVAALPVPKAGPYQFSADLNPNSSPTATVKASFVRWLDNVYTANRTIDVTGPATYTMGLRIAYRASVQYVDQNNKPVDPKLVDDAEFSTGTGTDNVILNSQVGAGQVWWTAASVARVTGQLVPTSVTYRVLAVKIHGADVVNRGQQAWTPTENGVWTIQLLLYPMTVQTRDAVFGMPVTGQLKLVYPDGTTVVQSVDKGGLVTFENLPRGQYQLSLHPAAVSPPTPVALSRPQDATLRVITYLDVAVGAGIVILGILVLFMIGRGSLILRRRRRRSSVGVRQPAA